MDLWLPEDVTLEDTEDGVKFSDNFTSEYIGDKVQAARYDYNICSGPYMFTSYDENSYAYTLTKNPISRVTLRDRQQISKLLS